MNSGAAVPWKENSQAQAWHASKRRKCFSHKNRIFTEKKNHSSLSLWPKRWKSRVLRPAPCYENWVNVGLSNWLQRSRKEGIRTFSWESILKHLKFFWSQKSALELFLQIRKAIHGFLKMFSTLQKAFLAFFSHFIFTCLFIFRPWYWALFWPSPALAQVW